MAPEQAAGKKADLRVDVYAVGVILYEMFTGAVPFTGDSFMAVLAAHLNDTPPPMTEVNPQIAISPDLQTVIMQALVKSPDERYGSMTDFANAIVSTPEGGALGRMSTVPSHDGGSIFPAAGAPATAAQFATRGLGATGGTQGAPAVTAGAGTAQIGTPDGAEATTQLSGQASTVAPQTGQPGVGLVLGSLGFVVVAGGIGAFVLFSGAGAEVPAEEPVAAASANPEPPKPEPEPEKDTTTVAPAVSAQTPPSNEVTLHVVTEPPGASVDKGGFQVCAETPCDIVVDKKEGVELTAKKGNLKGTAKILAQRDDTVTIKLKAPVVRKKPPKPASTGKPMCETMVGGLKILRPCE